MAGHVAVGESASKQWLIELPVVDPAPKGRLRSRFDQRLLVDAHGPELDHSRLGQPDLDQLWTSGETVESDGRRFACVERDVRQPWPGHGDDVPRGGRHVLHERTVQHDVEDCWSKLLGQQPEMGQQHVKFDSAGRTGKPEADA